SGRLIAGSLLGATSPVLIDSPQFYVHWRMPAGSRVSLPAEYPERAVYVASGQVEVAGQRVEPGAMAVLEHGRNVTIAALGDAVVMALGGEPVGPRYIDWNFVSSSKGRIDQARADWQAGRMKLPDLDNEEFIPLPPKISQGREPEPMSGQKNHRPCPFARKNRMIIRKPIFVLAACGIALGALAQPPEMPAPPVVVETIALQPVNTPQEFLAQVEAIEAVDLQAQVSGVLQQVMFEAS